MLAVLAIGAAPTVAQELTSPGPLAGSHAEFEAKCDKCHVQGKGAVDDDKCLDCHKVAKTSKFHAALVEQARKPCAGCHRDHRGRGFAMVRWVPPKTFDHGDTGYPLAGAHALQTCKACHRVPQRWMGLRQDCSSCHRDQHKPSLGSHCDKCHTDREFTGASRFDHDLAGMRLEGKHREVGCAQCHKAKGLQGRYRGIAHSACADCHRAPESSKASGGHAGGRDCKDCHDPRGWEKVPPSASLDLHRRTRLPLLGRHAETPCEKCHKPATSTAKGMARPVQTPLDPSCVSCHRDPHARRFGQDCKQCHGFFEFRLLADAPWSHSRTRFALLGKHARLACTNCHKPGPSYTAKYLSRDGDRCTDCHADPHGGPFASVAQGDRCDTCHTVNGFTPAQFGVAEHAKARFDLQGSHRVAGCVGCHPPAKESAAAVSPGGHRVAQLRKLPMDCASCHRDIHGGQFQKDAKPSACDTCHDTSSFLDHPRFDHGRTQFPLTGAHAKPACADCHTRPADTAPVQFAGLNLGCAGCHSDRHAGQMSQDGPARTCSDCHNSEKTFKIDKFDHGKTRFALSGQHLQVECAKCHPLRPGSDGKPTPHYRLGPLSCEACHRDPHGDMRAKQPAGAALSCGNCHQTTAWGHIRSSVAFDHASTGSPLSGAHQRAPCSGCHQPAQRTQIAVPKACADCHRDPHRGELGDACSNCHSATNWRAPRSLPSHETTRFPLTGAHTATDCRACHTRLGGSVYRGTPSVCSDCHLQQAMAVKTPDHRIPGFGPGCQTCHGTFAWRPARLNHAVWWPLQGKHAQQSCETCHTLGVFRGKDGACLGCHQDDLAKAHPDHKLAGFGTQCQQCHSALSWQLLKKDWHDGYFEISKGEHKGLSCVACHGPGGYKVDALICTSCHTHAKAAMDKEHKRFDDYVWNSKACYDCHRD